MAFGEAAVCNAYDALIAMPDRSTDALLADTSYDVDAVLANLAE
ncbi:MAG: hypothetical protein ABGW87_12705 [Sphingomonadaceae bacterium]